MNAMIRKLKTALYAGAAYRRARSLRFTSREQLECWQEQKVQAHLAYIVARSAYYRELVGDMPLEDWRKIPVTTKREMMRDFTNFNTLNMSTDELTELAEEAERNRDYRRRLRGATIGMSSGTTGSRSLFLASPRDCGLFLGNALAKLLPGGLLKTQRIALFHRSNSNLYRSLNTAWIHYAFFNLDREIESQFPRLAEFNPTILIGPPSALKIIGEGKRSGSVDISPRRVLSVAEVLELTDQDNIENDFAVRMDQAYIATEGFIAATCPAGVLHINEDLLVMQREWLDEQMRFVPVITDFYRQAQPIIRFRLDDVLIAGNDRCQCGSVFATLKRIEGRADDVLIFPDREGEGTRRIFPDFVRRAVLNAVPTISDFRVTQESLGSVTIEVSAQADERVETIEKIASSLDALFRRMNCEAPQLNFCDYQSTAGGAKRRRVKRSPTINFR